MALRIGAFTTVVGVMRRSAFWPLEAAYSNTVGAESFAGPLNPSDSHIRDCARCAAPSIVRKRGLDRLILLGEFRNRGILCIFPISH